MSLAPVRIARHSTAECSGGEEGVARRSGRSSGDNWKRQQEQTAAGEAAERERHTKETARQAQQDHLAAQHGRTWTAWLIWAASKLD